MVRLLIGLWVFGTGEALLVSARAGNSPWTVLAEGVALNTPITVGMSTIAVSAAVMCLWIPLRERPGLGTVCNAIVVGIAIDVMLPLLPAFEAMPLRIAQAVLGVMVVGLGSGLYLSARLGPGPRDGLMTGINRRTGWPVSAVRFGIEATVLAAGWFLGGTVGVGTVVFAVMIGPAVGTALRLLARPTAERA